MDARWTVPSLVDSKRREIEAHLRGLTAEFDHWRKQSAERAPLEKHSSQIRGITLQLEGLRDRLQLQLETAQRSPLVAGQFVEQDLLELFRVWEFFRSKLAQRENARLRPYLDAADELAWQCYEPVRKAAIDARHIDIDDVREPPLVFLNGGASPFAQPRHSAYEVEPVSAETLGREQFRQVLQSLPIPVLGMPWFQVAHLPDVIVIAHEVGHHIEDDIGLTNTLKRRIGGCISDNARREVWLRWFGEAFADVFGATAMGRAFILSMMDVLASAPKAVASERRDGLMDIYPTIGLRIRLMLEVVRRRAGAEIADPLWTRWTETYGTAHAMSAYEPDIPNVVNAFAFEAFSELGGKTIDALLPFSRETESESHELALLAPTKRELRGGQARILFAAMRCVFDADAGKPTYTQTSTRGIERLRDYLLATRAIGVRARTKKTAAGRERDALDRETGAKLVELFAELRHSLPPDAAETARERTLQPRL